MTVNNPDTGDKLVIDTVTSAAAGSTCPPGATSASCRVTIPVLTPGLTIAATASAASTVPGGAVTYTITVTDTGQTPYAGAAFSDDLTGVLDDAAYGNNATATGGTAVSFASPVLTWTGSLAPGGAATITYSVTVNTPDTGDGTLTNTVTSATAGSNCAAGSADPRCTATVTVAQLAIVNTANMASTTPGGVVGFTATFTNTGQVPYTGITITTGIGDVLDDATPNGDETATSGTLTLTPAAITWTGSIAVGAVVTVTGTVTVNNPDTGSKTLTATLTSAAPGNNCPSGGTDARCAVSVTVLTPALTITKTANVSTAAPGSVVDYTITVDNTGQTPYTGAAFSDPLTGVLDDASYDGDVHATAGTASFASSNLSWAGDLAVGVTATITYSVTVNSPDTGDKTMTNTVTSATIGSNCPPAGGNAGCTATVQVLTPGLTITKTADTATAVPGTTVTYTITVKNTGQIPYTAATSTAATVTDPLAGVLGDATWGAVATATTGIATYDPATQTLTWTGDLAPATDTSAGQSATITYTVTVGTPATLTNTVTSTTAGSNCPQPAPSSGGDPRCSATVTVVSAAALTITNTADVASAVAGGVVHYTVTVADTGGSAYTGATFTDDLSGLLDDATYNGASVTTTATAGADSLSYTAEVLTWSGNLDAGDTATISFSVTVNTPDTGDKAMSGTVTSATAGSNCPQPAPSSGGDPRCTSTVTVSQLAIASTYPASTTPGAVFRIDTTFTNTGQTPYSGITISVNGLDLIDDAIVNGDQTVSSGTLVDYGTGAAWTGDIPVGGTVTLSAGFTTKNPDPGNQVITATFYTTAPGSNCPPAGGNAACTATIDVLTPALSIVKTANTTSAVPGQAVTYTITITDTGQTPYTGATVTDTLDLLDDADYGNDATVASAGSVAYAAPVLTWTGDLAVGGSAVITYSVTVHNPATGDKTMVDTVTSAATGATCPPGATGAGCRVTVPVLTPALTITKTASTAATTPGGTVGYTVTVTDSGQTDYAGATFSDDLAGVLDDATYNTGAAATVGSLTVVGLALTWTGDLAAGASAVITYSVTVNNPDTDNHILTNAVTSTTAGSNCPPGGADPRCSATVEVAQLAISFTANVATTTPGGVVVLTATLANTGQVPYTGISVANNATGMASDATSNGDQTATSGTLSQGTTGDVWTGNIAPGGTVTVTGSATVNNPDTGAHLLTATLSTAAPGSNCPAGSPGPACTVTVTVLTTALTIVKTANTTSVAPGATVTYTITVTDTGQTPYSGATVTDDLTDVLDEGPYGGGSATAGAVSYTAPVLTWTGNLAAGASATITYTVAVNNPATGGKLLVNSAVSADPGSTCPAGSTNTSCTADVTVLTAALSIIKTADTSTATPGSAVHYTITVTDTGQTPYTGATVTDPLTGVLDDATYSGGATAASTGASAGTITYPAQVLTWTGNLAAGDVVTITYAVTVNNPDTGNGILTNTVTSPAAGSTCPTGTTRASCTVTVDVTALTITNTANVATATPGSVVGYTVTVTNSGQAPIPGATFTADFAGVADDTTYNGDLAVTAGGMTLDPATASATWTGDLAPGASVTVTGSFTVNNPDTGDRVLTETVDSTTPGNNCPTSTPCTSTVDVIVGTLSITVPAGAGLGTPDPGATVNAGLGTVEVTDDRALAGATWTATVSSTNFTTGAGTTAETIPAADATYFINALASTTGTATFTPTPVTILSGAAQAVVTVTNGNGDNSASWDPAVQVSVPATAVAGTYTATITHSVS